MKKPELIAATAELSGYRASVVRTVLDAAADATRAAISNGDDVFLLGVGKLTLHQRGERVARNMATGQPCIVPPRTVVRFHPSVSLEAAAAASRPLGE